jgi:hypothetical protein
VSLPPVSRRSFLHQTAAGVAALCASRTLRAAQTPACAFDPTTDIIKAPEDPALWPQFREKLTIWREQRRRELHQAGIRVYLDSLIGGSA